MPTHSQHHFMFDASELSFYAAAVVMVGVIASRKERLPRRFFPWAHLAVMAVVTNLIADEGATAASTVTYLLPIVAVVLGVLILSEPLSWNLAVAVW